VNARALVPDWIRGQSPAPPAQLLARVTAMTAGAVIETTPAAALISAGEAGMAAVLRGGCLTRDSALDLLAVDALVTYAFEAAADEPEALEALSTNALRRIAALAEAQMT
jgi:hypothetical protein